MKVPRSLVSLLTALCFCVLAGTGVLAFLRPFSLRLVGLHALIGFVFVAIVVFHLLNNQVHLRRYGRSPSLWISLLAVTGLTLVFVWQPAPIRGVLGLSHNLGPALDRFEFNQEGFIYVYTPDPNYRLKLSLRKGRAFQTDDPPELAIWLENASFYHIKTLHRSQHTQHARESLPYWDFKVRGWEKAKLEADQSGRSLAEVAELDGVSKATQNSSFNPKDYIVPYDSEASMPYRMLVEINQPGDNQPSLVYSVEIDNADPRTFQLLELVGYPKQETSSDGGEEKWDLYYVDQTFDTALELIDSVLLTIEREMGS